MKVRFCNVCGKRMSKDSRFNLCAVCWQEKGKIRSMKDREFAMFEPFKYSVFNEFLDELNALDDKRKFPNLMRILPKR